MFPKKIVKINRSNLEYRDWAYHPNESVKNLTEKLLESFEELNILYDISQSLTSIYNIKEICDIALAQMNKIVPSKEVFISLMDNKRENVTVIACRGFANSSVGRKIEIKNTVYGNVIEQHRPLLTKNICLYGRNAPKRQRIKDESSIIRPLLILPMIVKEEVIGIISMVGKPDDSPFTARDIKFLSAIAAQAAIVIQNAKLITNLNESFLITVRSLSAAIDAKDHYTRGHSERVSTYALAIGRTLGINQEDLKQLELACLLHDVGKIGIPESILNKAGKLSAEEFDIIRQHPLKGLEILKNTKQTEIILAAIRSHHERYDGHGYPDGLTGEQIPLLARIISVADAYDAMTSDRSYRPKCSQKKAVNEIRSRSGSQFDPKMVWAFLKWLELLLIPVFVTNFNLSCPPLC